MNPESPRTPREEIEIRMTALLMGELSPEEAADLQMQIEGDAELATLFVRLKRAAGLLREASAAPEESAPPIPARLSDERRARLLAHFKGETKPGPVIVKPRRDWKWAVPLGLAASLMALIGGAMYVNGFALRKASRSGEATLRLSDSAESAVMSQIRESTTVKNGTWASQPGMIRVYSSEKGLGASNETDRSYHRYSSVDEFRYKSEATRKLQTTDGGRRAGDGRAKLSASDSGFYAGSYWDTPRVQTYFDGGVSESPDNFRGGLAGSQPPANEFQRYPGKTSTASPGGTGALYLPKAATDISDGAFGRNASTGVVAQAGGGGAPVTDRLSVSAGGVISNPTSATASTREALDQTSPVAFSSLSPAKGKPDAELDLFSLPVSEPLVAAKEKPLAEPHDVSEPFSTAGKVTLNSALAPFSNLHSPRPGIANAESESTVALHGWSETNGPAPGTPLGTVVGGGGAIAASLPTATPSSVVTRVGANVAALDFNKPAAQAEPAYPTPIVTSAPVARAVAESAPEPRAAEEMKRRLYFDVSGLQRDGTGLPALADVAGKEGTLDINGTSQIVGNLSGAGGVTKNGAGTVVLSGSSTYAGSTTISGGSLTFNGGIAGVAGPQPTTKPASAEPPSAGKPESDRRLARANTASDSQVAPGRWQNELSVAEPKPGARMDSDTDGLARDGRDKPATTSLGLGLSNVTDLYSMAPQKGIKGEAANGRGEAAATLRGNTITNGTETAARKERGEKQADGPAAFSKTPATPSITALGDKPGLSPDVVEFEGFVNYGTRIQTPAAGQPSSGPASDVTKFLTVNKTGATGQPGRLDDPAVGRIGFWNDDEAAKLNIRGNTRTRPEDREKSAAASASGAAMSATEQRLKQLHYFSDLNQPADLAQGRGDFGIVPGVVSAGSGGVALNKTGAGHWSFAGANTFTVGTNVNGGTLSVNGAVLQTSPANGESDGRKTLNDNGTGNTGETFAGVITKSGQRADAEVKREFGYEKEFDAPEIPKSLGGEGRGIVTKTGDGTFSLGGASSSNPATANREIARRMSREELGREETSKGQEALKKMDYEAAFSHLKNASENIPAGSPAAADSRKTAVDDLAKAGVKLAEQRVSEGYYASAVQTLQEVLKNDPKSPEATRLLSKIEEPEYFNKQITPQHRAKVDEVKKAMVEAKGYTDLGRFDLADRKYQEVLGKDPYNEAANKGREEAANLKGLSARAGYNATRAQAMWEVDKEWARPARRFDRKVGEVKDDAKKGGATAARGTVAGEPAAQTEMFDDIRSARISNPRGGTVEGEAERKLADVQKMEVEELGVDRLADQSEVTFSAEMPVTGKRFRSGQTAAKPAAPAGEVESVKKETVDEEVTLRDREKQEKSGDSKDAVVALGTGTVITSEKLQKDVAPAQRKQLEAALKGTSEIAEQLQEKRVDELKSELKEIKKVAEREPEAPKPAANPPIPQPEIRTGENAFSTFSLNVSDVAFKLAGASLERGTMPDVSTLRTEEFINAFDYRDPEAAPGAPLAFASERARYPFAQNRDVVRFSVKTACAGRQPGKPLNVVLLLDNSGSMERADRVRILQEGLRTLSAQLQPQDKLSVVTFARTPRLWADGVAGNKAGEVTARVGEITPEGGTNLAAALDLGYATALKHYQPGSINHVVLLTDGAANLGNVDPAALKQKVEAHRKQGIALDCFGIGWEGLNDDMLEQLSRNGDGRYGFINTPEEAATNFAGQLVGALRVSASDVKVQVEWNPKRVTSYRQVGYAKHQLTKEQFRDNTVDAAELAAAESGNALYVVEVNPQGTGDLATVRVRFKVPGTSDYREHEWTVPFTRAAAPLENSSSSLRLAASAAAFSEMLAGSPFATEVSSDRLLGLLTGVPAIYGADARPRKLEWMIRQAKSLSGR